MKRSRNFLSLCLLFGFVTSLPLSAGNWGFLGERTVSFRNETDTIKVGAKDGTFKKIKLKVKKSGVHLIDLKIHYASGDVQDVAIRSFIKAGGESRVIDLSGQRRVISKVTFRYKSPNRKKGKAQVRLFGKH